MASETGLSHTTIRRIWNAFGLQPHRAGTFKLSTDPLFVDKVIVGLHLPPPNRAIVLCVDEKAAHSSAIRAGWCSGATQLPERTPIFFVTAATAAPVNAGLG